MDNDFDSAVQKQLDAAMPWVGLYIAAASAVCILAMAADAVNSFRHKKLWFPCKYSSLNAASLTLLAVAMKLPMDLNTVMIKSEIDVAAKYTSLFFMSTTVINFMPSLGSMNDTEVVANVVGLGILVMTVMGNVGIQLIELRRFLKPVSSMKSSLKSMYEEKHYAILKEEENLDMDDNERRHIMMKYWVMAESCSPQFVIARSVVCTAAAMICWFSFVILTFVHFITGTSTHGPAESTYGGYTKWIAFFQIIGEMIGVIVVMLRWFITVMFRCSTTYSNSFSEELKVENYWIQSLKDWRSSFTGLQIRPNRFRKYVHDVK